MIKVRASGLRRLDSLLALRNSVRHIFELIILGPSLSVKRIRVRLCSFTLCGIAKTVPNTDYTGRILWQNLSSSIPQKARDGMKQRMRQARRIMLTHSRISSRRIERTRSIRPFATTESTCIFQRSLSQGCWRRHILVVVLSHPTLPNNQLHAYFYQ